MDTQTVLLGGLSDDLLLGCDGCDSQMAGLGSPFAEKGASGGLTATQAGVVTSANPLARVATAQARARELATKNARAAELNRTAAAKLQKEGKGVLAQQAANQSLQATADAARYAAAAKGYEGAKKLAASAEQAERKGDARAASGFRAALGTMLTAVNKTLSTPIAAGAEGIRAVGPGAGATASLPHPQATRVPPGVNAVALARASGMGLKLPPSLPQGTNQAHVAGPMPGIFGAPNAGRGVNAPVPKQQGYAPSLRLSRAQKATFRATGFGDLGGLGGPVDKFVAWTGKLASDPKGALKDAADGVKNTVTKVAEQAIGAGSQAAGQQIAQAVAPPAAQASTANSVTQQIQQSSLPGADGGIGAGIPGGTTTIVLGVGALAAVGFLLTRKRGGGLNGYGMGAYGGGMSSGTKLVAGVAAVGALAYWWKNRDANPLAARANAVGPADAGNALTQAALQVNAR